MLVVECVCVVWSFRPLLRCHKHTKDSITHSPPPTQPPPTPQTQKQQPTPHPQPRALALLLHGVTGASHDHYELMERLAGVGILAVGFDRRGHGGLPLRRARFNTTGKTTSELMDACAWMVLSEWVDGWGGWMAKWMGHYTPPPPPRPASFPPPTLKQTNKQTKTLLKYHHNHTSHQPTTHQNRGPGGLEGGDRPHLRPLPRPPALRRRLLRGLLPARAVRRRYACICVFVCVFVRICTCVCMHVSVSVWPSPLRRRLLNFGS